MANDRGLPVTPKTTKPATKPRPATIRKTSRRAPTSYAETLYIATSSPSPATPGLKPSNTLAPKATATRRRTRLGYRRRQSSGTTCNSKRRRPTTTTVTAPPGVPTGRGNGRSPNRRSMKPVSPSRKRIAASTRSKVRGRSRPIQPHPRVGVSTGYRVAMLVERRIHRANEAVTRAAEGSGRHGRGFLRRLTPVAPSAHHTQDHWYEG